MPKHSTGRGGGLAALLALLLGGCLNDPPWGLLHIQTSHGIVGYPYEVSAAYKDPEGKRVGYRFDFGDGDTSDWSGWLPSGDSWVVTHAWQQPGSYAVMVQVRDEEGYVSGFLGLCGQPGDPALIEISEADFPYRVVDTIRVGVGATGVALSPDGELLYVTNSAENTVSVVRTDGDSVIATVAVGQGPEAVAVTPSGEYVYVANRAGNDVSVIRASDNAVVDTLPANYEPVDMAFSPDGKYLYIAIRRENDVLVIRTADNERETMIQTAMKPEAVLATPDGRWVIVACSSDDSLQLVDADSNEVAGSWSTVREPVALTAPAAGSPVYVLGRMSQLHAFTPPGGRAGGSGSGGFGSVEAYDIAALPDGRYLHISQPGLFRVVVADPEFRFVCAIPVGTEPRRIAVHPDGQRVYVADYSFSVYVLGK